MKTEEEGGWDGAEEVIQGLVDCETHSRLYFKGSLMPLKDFKHERQVIIIFC